MSTLWDGIDWIDLAQDRDQWRALVNTVINLRIPQNAGKLLSSCTIGGFWRRTELHEWVSTLGLCDNGEKVDVMKEIIFNFLIYAEWEKELLRVMKISIFWDIMSYSPVKLNLCFGGTCLLHLQGRRISLARIQHEAGSRRSHKHNRENFRSYILWVLCFLSRLMDFLHVS
jgi:hypothetical protein